MVPGSFWNTNDVAKLEKKYEKDVKQSALILKNMSHCLKQDFPNYKIIFFSLIF